MRRTSHQRHAGRDVYLSGHSDGHWNRRYAGDEHDTYGNAVKTRINCLFEGLALAALFWYGHVAHSQALPTATGPGSYVIVGGTFSDFESDYGQQRITG